jgi:DNA-directed RNA polymerase specialized sigma24 family protein
MNRASLVKPLQNFVSYWYPLYAFARRRGHSPEDAQDLTQEFLARLLEKNRIGDADRSKYYQGIVYNANLRYRSISGG